MNNEITKDLKQLKKFWDRRSNKTRSTFYNDCDSIDEFCEDLDILIKKCTEILGENNEN